MAKSKKKYYVVLVGRKSGVYNKFVKANNQVSGLFNGVLKGPYSYKKALLVYREHLNFMLARYSDSAVMRSELSAVNSKLNALGYSFSHPVISPSTINFKPLHGGAGFGVVEVFADGSYFQKTGRGAVAVYVTDNKRCQREVGEFLGKIKSSLTAEVCAALRAILLAEEIVADGYEVHLYLDNQDVIASLGERGNTRWQKQEYGEYYRLLKKKFKRISSSVKVHHVKAHTKKTDRHSKGNQKVDGLAKTIAHGGKDLGPVKLKKVVDSWLR